MSPSFLELRLLNPSGSVLLMWKKITDVVTALLGFECPPGPSPVVTCLFKILRVYGLLRDCSRAMASGRLEFYVHLSGPWP